MLSHPACQSFVFAIAAPRAPSWRARYADMTQMGFIELVAGWSSALVMILAVSAFIRFVG